MRDALFFFAAGSVIGFFVGFGVYYPNDKPEATRYELHDSGIAGLVVRLDKQTGKIDVIPATAPAP